jgi:hypothetical protein
MPYEKKIFDDRFVCAVALSLYLSDVSGQEVVRLAYSAISGAVLTP